MKKINKKRLKFKVNNTVVIAFAIICVVLLNSVAGLLEERVPRLKIDLTEDAITKLTKETKTFLKTVDNTNTKIEIIYLKGTNSIDTITKDVLEQYDYYSENVKWRELNYHKNPTLLQAFNISSSQIVDGTIIVTNSDVARYRAVLPTDVWAEGRFLLEEKLTNAIGYVVNTQSVNVCVATGYGSDEYIGGFLEALIGDNLTVSRIDLSTNQIPDGIDVLVLMSPFADLTAAEVKSIDDYSLKGGNIIVALPSYALNLPNLETYLKYWGISVNSDLIYEYDETSSYEQTGAAFFAQNDEHIITEGIKGRILVTNARSLNFTPTGDMSADKVLSTTNKAVAVPQNKEEITKEDIVCGPFTIGYAVERPLNGSWETTSKLIVTSTPCVWGVESIEDVINQSRFGNRAFISNAMGYASGKSVQSVLVPEKNSSENVMAISVSQSLIFTLVFCLILPIAVLVWGFVVWFKRRNK